MALQDPHPSVPAISVRDVRKSFPRRRPVKELLAHPFRLPKRVPALRGVSLVVEQGEMVALLGPNGAGKTTLLKTLCGLVIPESGSVDIGGIPAGSAGLSRVLGLVHGEERSFYWRLTARENLEFYARLHGLEGRARRSIVGELLERVELAEDADRRFGDFSSGMRQRMAIARALLADPPVLLMDEPTRSLDPLTASRLRAWIRDELHERAGKAILIATHNLREAETLCQRVAILARGRMLAAETPAALRRRGLGGLHYRLRVAGLTARLNGNTRVLEEREEDGRRELLVQLAGEESLAGLLATIHEAGGRIEHCAPEEPDLEQVFEKLVREQQDEDDDEADANGREAS